MSKKIKSSSLFIGFLDLILLAFLVFDFGFTPRSELKMYKAIALPLILFLLIGFNLYKNWKYRHNPAIKKSIRPNLIILSILVVIEIIFIFINYNGSVYQTFFENRKIIEYGLLFYFFIRLTFLMRYIFRYYFNPAILFVGSYVLVIFAGASVLMLPSATTHAISFTDALFTSTSAVCVTGLLVLDTAKDFTTFGQSTMMVLMQLGGLGMLTFTSFFAYFFKSGGSVKEGLFMKNVLGGDQLNNIMQSTVRIVVFAFSVEAVGALFIFNSIKNTAVENHAFFAVFHAISAFNNAGFSTLSSNFMDPSVRFNYYLQWIVMVLIIFGGLGYFISFNFIKYLKHFFINLLRKQNRKKFIQRVITLNTKIVVYTTIILIFSGTIFFLLSEYNGVLAMDHTFFGKWTTSMFSSVTARTCGFATVDYSKFSVPGLLIMILLMWIGASPGSTGGGIKTSSFALATLNIFSTARNKPHIEIGTRRVAGEAVQRAFSIIIISLIGIGIGILLLLIFNPEYSLMQVAFEIFSAFGTVGLSMGITPHLAITSKYVVIFMMFFGRIGLINLMSGMLKDVATQEYEYPKENILIN